MYNKPKNDRFLEISKVSSICLFLADELLMKAQLHLIPQFFYLSKEVSPGGQTPLLSWCLFSAACADSPAEEGVRRVMNRNRKVKRKKIE